MSFNYKSLSLHFQVLKSRSWSPVIQIFNPETWNPSSWSPVLEFFKFKSSLQDLQSLKVKNPTLQFQFFNSSNSSSWTLELKFFNSRTQDLQSEVLKLKTKKKKSKSFKFKSWDLQLWIFNSWTPNPQIQLSNSRILVLQL